MKRGKPAVETEMASCTEKHQVEYLRKGRTWTHRDATLLFAVQVLLCRWLRLAYSGGFDSGRTMAGFAALFEARRPGNKLHEMEITTTQGRASSRFVACEVRIILGNVAKGME